MAFHNQRGDDIELELSNIYKLGEVNIEITGTHKIIELLHKELLPSSVSSAKSDISFHISDKKLPQIPSNAFVVGPVFALPDRVWFHLDSIGFREFIFIDRGKGGGIKTKVRISVEVIPPKTRLTRPTIVRQLRDRTFLTPLEQSAYSFINGILEPSLLFFGQNTALLHASAIEKDGKAILFPSTGGTGKTTLSLSLVIKHEYRYLADDILLMLPDGIVNFYPRYVMLYAYSLQGLSPLEHNFLSQRRLLDRVHWSVMKYIRGLKGTRRRVCPSTLFGEQKIAPTAKIHRVFFLVRHPRKDFHKEEASPSDLAKICSHVLLSEYSFYINYLRYWELSGYSPITEAILLSRLTDIYNKAFKRAVEVAIIRIPFSATPKLLEQYFVKILERD